jgi:hypothetical protein
MFERLVGEIRKHHVFSNVWPEVDWARELPVLERELLGARNRRELLLALCHLSNSLRDGHLTFSACPNADGPQTRLGIPVAFSAAGRSDAPHFIISQAEASSGVAPGDVLLEYDNVPSEALLEHFRLELNAASANVRVEQLTTFLNRRYTLGREALEGEPVPFTVRHGAHVVSAQLAWRAADAVNPPPAPGLGCAAPVRDYGAGYTLVEVGAHVCLYRASRAPFASHPIVRQISFLYKGAEFKADRERIRAFLARVPRVDGVLLDLRDNGGGRAAEYFLPWYASGPYQGAKEWVHLDRELTDRKRLLMALRHDAAVDEYLRRAESGVRWWVRAFDCATGNCPAGPETARSQRVTSAPIALLLGPGCRSACDMFAAIWTRQGFGPTIGAPPAAMYTSLRYPLAVTLGDAWLGDFEIALCGLRLEGDALWLEGRSLSMDSAVEPSWPFGARDVATVRAAVEALQREPTRSAHGAARR